MKCINIDTIKVFIGRKPFQMKMFLKQGILYGVDVIDKHLIVPHGHTHEQEDDFKYHHHGLAEKNDCKKESEDITDMLEKLYNGYG